MGSRYQEFTLLNRRNLYFMIPMRAMLTFGMGIFLHDGLIHEYQPVQVLVHSW